MRERLLEGWLPLAQEASQRFGWGLDPPELEVLVLQAAGMLAGSRTMHEAWLSLWTAYQQHYASEDA